MKFQCGPFFLGNRVTVSTCGLVDDFFMFLGEIRLQSRKRLVRSRLVSCFQSHWCWCNCNMLVQSPILISIQTCEKNLVAILLVQSPLVWAPFFSTKLRWFSPVSEPIIIVFAEALRPNNWRSTVGDVEKPWCNPFRKIIYVHSWWVFHIVCELTGG